MVWNKEFKDILKSFLLYAAIPSVAWRIAPEFGFSNFQGFFTALFFMWVLSIELRLKYLGKDSKKRK